MSVLTEVTDSSSIISPVEAGAMAPLLILKIFLATFSVNAGRGKEVDSPALLQ